MRRWPGCQSGRFQSGKPLESHIARQFHGPWTNLRCAPHVVHNALIAGSSAASGSLQTEAHRMCGVLYCVRYKSTIMTWKSTGPGSKVSISLLARDTQS
jgi:hypothetical protein